MLDIRKISEDTYLVNGEYITTDYNKALHLANKDRLIPNLIIGFKKINFFKIIKYQFNLLFETLEEWM